jgi:hypothetical protein
VIGRKTSNEISRSFSAIIALKIKISRLNKKCPDQLGRISELKTKYCCSGEFELLII